MKNKKIQLFLIITLGIILIVVGILNIKKDRNSKNDQNFSYTPLTYKICDNDNCVYLLGSIHLGDERVNQFNDIIIDAYNESDYLAVEIDTYDMNIDVNEYLLDNSGNIEELLSEELNEKLEQFAKDHPLFMYDSLKNFKLGYIADYLSLVPYIEIGYIKEGVDSYFTQLAHKQNKEIISLETYEEQLELLLGSSDEFYIKQIENVIDNYDTAKLEVKYLYDTYLKSDPDSLKKLIDMMMQTSEDEEEISYNRAIYDDRNKKMADKVVEFLDNDQNVFVVVGCAHVVGSNGIVDLLNDKYQISIVK